VVLNLVSEQVVYCLLSSPMPGRGRSQLIVPPPLPLDYLLASVVLSFPSVLLSVSIYIANPLRPPPPLISGPGGARGLVSKTTWYINILAREEVLTTTTTLKS
jgi:hypothetical protein